MKSVIITGTSKGIGLETALAFAQTEPAYGKSPKAGHRQVNETINDFF